MKTIRYFSEFYDRDGNLYRIEILQEGSFTPQEVTLAGNPITIEWGEVDKFEPVMSSSATLRLVSMTDRQFVDMYAVEVGAIRMDVYRNGSLYWCGTLDTELFEEPYSDASRYVTEVTFSDFAVLSRLRWSLTGFKTLRQVTEECLAQCQITYSEMVTHISTSIPDSDVALLDAVTLTMDNFYDEDGEAWTTREVLDEVLRPFALRFKQKNGQIIIADINALSTLTPQDVEWRATDAVLGVEPTYNRVKLTFSPYSETVLFDGSFDTDETLKDASEIEQTTSVVVPDTNYVGFVVKSSAEYSALTKVQGLNIGGGVRVFKIEGVEGGEDTAGVMWGIRPLEGWVGNQPINKTIDYPYTSALIMQSDKFSVLAGLQSYKLAVSIEVLYDVRRNPYESAGGSNEEGNWERFNDWANFGAIPVKLVHYGYDGKTYSFDNSEVYANEDDIDAWYGEWVEGDGGVMWLEFYNPSDRRSATGFGGWQKNKQSIGFWNGGLPASTTLHIESEKIPLPPVSGELQFSVYAGTLARDYSDNEPYPDVASISRWMLYRNPQIAIVQHSGLEIDPEDVEISAWVNKAAEKELSIDTYFGSAYNKIPFAKGIALDSSTNTPIQNFIRAGQTDTLEKLLIGSIYSNYNARRSNLSGTVKLISEETILSDISSVNSKYLMLSEVQEVQDGMSTIKMAEIVEDNFVGIEYGAI